MADELNVSQRKFAEHIGKTNVWVHKLVKAGKLPTNPDGSIPLAKALDVYKQMNGGKSDTLPSTEDAVNVGMSYNQARAAKENAIAQLRQLELRQKKGELVEKAEVEAMVSDLAERVRGKLLSVPVRVAGLCEGRTAREIEDILETEINAAMAELQTGLVAKE